MTVKLLTEYHLEIISLKEDFAGTSEFTLVKIPHVLEITGHGTYNIVCQN